MKQFNLTSIKSDIFLKWIYPLYAEEFLFGDNYEEFAKLISMMFVLSPEQWEYILEWWELKESTLKID